MSIRVKAVKDFGTILNLRLPVQKVAHLTILEMRSNIVHQNLSQELQFCSSLTVTSLRRISKLVLQNSMV